MKLKNYFLIITLSLSCVAFGQTGTLDSASIVVDGITRTYTYYVPQLYNSANVPVPLVINMHGATGTSYKQEIAEDFRKIADTANFIVVHPQGLNIPIYPGVPYNQTGWNVLGTVAAWKSDKVFIINLLEKLASQYSIKRSKVYLTGYSEGGFMSYDFACFVTGRFAAIASVSGSLVSSHFSACTPSQPTPVMEIHGTADGTISYTGGTLPPSIAVDTMVKYWVKYNHCNSIPNSIVHLPDLVDSCCTSPSDSSKVVHYVYAGGTRGTTVELYKVLGGGHQIPSAPPVPASYGNGVQNKDFTAAKEIWRFFSKYNLDSLGVSIVTGTITAVSTGINNLDSENENNLVSVYPNPSNGKFTVYVENNKGSNFQILNLLGTVVYEAKLTGKYTTIAIDESSKGIYFYRIINNTDVIKSGKLIIQ
jgi:polyhydroxybutyrate depolymerase